MKRKTDKEFTDGLNELPEQKLNDAGTADNAAVDASADGSGRTGLFSQKTRRRFRFGTNMLALAALALVLFIVLNLVLEHFSTALTLDLTKEKLFTLDEITEESMNALEKDVEVIALYDRVRGEADSSRISVIKVLDQYEQFDRVKVSYIDPDANPNFILDTVGRANASSYSSGDYIVKCGEKTRRIAEDDMYVITNQTYNSLFSIPVQTGMQAEKKLTTAILYVASDHSPVVYYITNHAEEDISGFSMIVTYIEGLGCEVKELDLTQVTEMPEDAAVAVLMGPKYDISNNERTMLQQWLEQKAGQLAVCVNPLQNGTEFVTLNSLLSDMFGLTLANDMVSDDSESNRISAAGSAFSFLGSSVSNGPIENSSVYRVPIFSSRSVNVLNIDESASGITHYPIIETEATALSTAIVGGEKSGPGKFAVAAASKNVNFAKTTHAIVFGSTLGLTDDYYTAYGAYTVRTLSIFAMGIDWMIESYGSNAGSELMSKNYSTTQLIATESQSNVLGIVATVVIPLIIIGVGLVVWLKRRHL